jgi:hypothetical protein
MSLTHRPEVIRHLRRTDRSDRGVAMVLFALLLVVLMVFAALAVDVGSGYAQIRRNQTAADEAVLAGGLRFLMTGSFTEAVKTARDTVGSDLASPPSDAAWNACTDPDALEISSVTVSPSNGSPCISFGNGNSNGTMRIRVRVPKVSQPTIFAAVIGLKTIKSSAVAVAQYGSPLGGALPIWVLRDNQPGDEICAIAAPGNKTPCSQDRGHFGGYLPYYYSIDGCPDGGKSNQSNYSSPVPAMALGLDHLLIPDWQYDPNNPTVGQQLNGGSLSGGKSMDCSILAPNTLDTTVQGNWTTALTASALITGNSSASPPFNGRLGGGPFANTGTKGDLQAISINSVQIDNAPLWYFLTDDVETNTSAPAECRAAKQLPAKRDTVTTSSLNSILQAAGIDPGTYATPEALMAACLSKWTPAAGIMFDQEIGTGRRLGIVPRFQEPTQVKGLAHIMDFVPVYLDGEYFKNGDAHLAGSGKSGNNLVAETGMMLPCLALPAELCQSAYNDTSASYDGTGFGGISINVSLVQ